MTVEIPVIAENVLTGILTAIVYSIVFYAKKKMKRDNPQKFHKGKFFATVVVGACVGASFGLNGVDITAGTVESTLAAYTGVIALTESMIKSIWRWYDNR